MSKKAIILASGGIDSSTVMAIAKQKGYEIYILSFNYLQRNSIEIEKVQIVAKQFAAKLHKIINIDLKTFGSSALTDDSFSVPKYSEKADLPEDVPITYVPARNTIFLSYALAFAEVVKAYDIFIGIHYDDRANYPDCRAEYIKSFEQMANLAVNLTKNQRLTIHAPLLNMSKAEIISTGLNLKVDYSNTISCYDPDKMGRSCGKCLACTIRLDAFAQNGVIDPIEYV